MMDEVGMVYDENNNEEGSSPTQKTGEFVERHLELNGDSFLIIPNGGSGDCMFKAVSQAVHDGDESKHKEIRKKVVDFIVDQKWDKFSESIEIQHISGNNLLQRQWAKNPRHTYKMYMNLPGTLGSSSELLAAGELFHYNYATIQEYCTPAGRTYRVENCILFKEEDPEFHYFYFTGDYDNGHWEFMSTLSNYKIKDGTYQGRLKTLIEGEEITVEEWLSRETENNNDAERLKIPIDRISYIRRRSLYPFELHCFEYGENGHVMIRGKWYTVANVDSNDLFSVLAHECLQNEKSASEAELILMKHRYSYFEDVNYKLITQPWSHNFTTQALKYCGHACKGNIQDLVSAADLYSFSFVLYMRLGDEDDEINAVHECKFTHVDRWGGESDRVLFFFMRLIPSPKCSSEMIAKWWRLIPKEEKPRSASIGSLSSKIFKQKRGSDSSIGSKSRKVPSNLENITEDRSHSDHDAIFEEPEPQNYINGNMQAERDVSKSTINSKKSSKPNTPRQGSATSARPASTSQLSSNRKSFKNNTSCPPSYTSMHRQGSRYSQSPSTTSDEDDEEACLTEDSIKQDCDNIFGSDKELSPKTSIILEKQALLKKSRLIKKRVKEKLKPATDRDLLEHPEKVKTVVKVCDARNSGREITYSGNGYIEPNEVLSDLGTQGLIRLPSLSAPKHIKPRMREEVISAYADNFSRKDTYENSMPVPDENFNYIDRPLDNRKNDESDVSYERFGPGAFDRKKETKDSQQMDHATHPKYELSKLKRNKVAPRPADISEHCIAKNSNYRHTVFETRSDEEVHDNFCFVLKVFFWLSSRIQKIIRQTKHGLRRRYERYINYKSSNSMEKRERPVSRTNN